MVDRIAQAIWFVILLVCLFAAVQYLSPQPVPDQDKEEKTVCGNQTKYSYEVDGNRYYVPYSTIDGQDVVEGDIVIGQAEGSGYFPPTVQPFVNGQATRWPGNVVPFIIDGSAEPFRPFIERAMTEWASHTNVKFEELSGIRDWRKENYVKFIKDSICESNSLGIKEKDPQQTDEEKNKINIVKVGGCYMDGKLSWGRIAHEIGHVLGLGHEHSRQDRNKFITVLWDNLTDKKQFCRGIWHDETLPNTKYDYDSIMHYSPYQDVNASDCKVKHDGKCYSFIPSKEKLPQWSKSPKIGQRDHLSNGDIQAVNTLYPVIQTTEPPPLPTSPCVIVTKTTIKVGDRIIETTKTEPCTPGGIPIPGDQQCCHEKIIVTPPAILTDAVPPSKLIGHDPIDGANRSGADHAHALSASVTAGSKIARLSTTGTTDGKV